MKFTRTPVVIGSVLVGIALWCGLAYKQVHATSSTKQTAAFQNVDWVKEGACKTPTLTAGPFDLHRRYRSMEGPYVSASFKVGDLIAGGTGDLPENRVRFVEKDSAPPSSATTGATAGNGPMAITGNLETPDGLKDTSKQPRELYWLKGFKLEVLDENGKVMPSAEFICHLNLDVDAAHRNKVFPDGERTTYTRLLTITQGQTEVHFPEGYAFPVSSDETFKVAFQAANRTTDEHRRVRHRATFYFVKDSDLTYPVTAMYVRTPFVGVVVDRAYAEAMKGEMKDHPTCEVMTRGVNAPNSTNGGTYTDPRGRVVTGHWVVPPGHHEYITAMMEQDPTLARKDRTMRYGWVHIHPFCTKAYIRECKGDSKSMLDEANITTSLKPNGMELTHIDSLGKQGGVFFPRNARLEMGAVYDNPTNTPLDSMVTLGMFFDDVDFKRPDWSLPGYHETKPFCGVECTWDKGVKAAAEKAATAGGAASTSTSSSADSSAPPVFDPKKDGPLLKAPVKLTVKTSEGPIHLTLEPSYAPDSASQIYKLFTHGVYDHTPFVRYDPNFVLQLAVAAHKINGPQLTPAQNAMIRTLPLEADAQNSKQIKHTKYVLSMARNDDDPNSAQTSFSILLNNAPHLDGKYTIIGRVDSDPQTEATLQKLEADIDKRILPTILSCSK